MTDLSSGRLRMIGGVALALVVVAGLTAIMAPFRGHLSSATPALVLLIPVIGGATVGGAAPGIVVAIAGFGTYDLFFIRPYGTLAVSAPQAWVALIVYLMVAAVVSQAIAAVMGVRREARDEDAETARLSELTQRLIPDRPLPQLLQLVAATVTEAFSPRWTAVLVPRDGRLEVVTTAGATLSRAELGRLQSGGGNVQTLGVWAPNAEGAVSVSLDVQGRPIGLLSLDGVNLDAHQRERLRLYADQAARAVERSQMRELAIQNEALKSSDRWRRALLGAVSHNLRTPLATVKAAVSALRESQDSLTKEEAAELLELVESQSDNLARLVTNLLDFTRIHAGTLQVQRHPTTIRTLVVNAVAALGGTLDGVERGSVERGSVGGHPVVMSFPDELSLVEVDELLMVQAVANVLDNARRHTEGDRPIEVTAVEAGGVVRLTVANQGAGVPPDMAERIFEMWTTSGGGNRSGLGLAIARAFVEAHHETIGLDPSFSSGARFFITMAASPPR